MNAWVWFVIAAVAAVALVVLVWWSSGRAGIRGRSTPAGEAEARAGMIETDALPGRSGFFH